jgi:hypothetical protein
MAIIAFVIVPLTVFVIHKQDIRSYMYHVWNLHEYVKYGLHTDPLFSSILMNSSSQGSLDKDDSKALSETQYSSKKTCNALFSTIESELLRTYPDIHTMNVASQVEMTAHIFKRLMKQSSIDILNHPRNIPTALEMRNGIDEHGSSGTLLYIGTNSASTTDTDLYTVIDKGQHVNSTFTEGSGISTVSHASSMHGTTSTPVDQILASSTSRFQVINAYEFGPGVVDMDISGSRMVIAERSAVTPVHILDMHGTSLTQTGYVTGDQIRYAYPKTIEMDTDHIYVGTEKHQYGELYVMRMPSFSSVLRASSTSVLFPELIPKASVVSEIEINAGVNDIDLSDTYVMVATPLNPEFLFFDRRNVTGYCTTSHTGLDAPPNTNIGMGQWQGNDTVASTSTESNICAPYSTDTAVMSVSTSSINHVSTPNINQVSAMNQIGNSASVHIFQPALRIDAPGSSGNGKSIYNEQDMVILGRTVGNAELLVTKLQFIRASDMRTRLMHMFEQGIETAINRVRNMIRTRIYTQELINPNQSIIHVIAPLNGAYIVAFTHEPHASIIIYKKITSPSAHMHSTSLFTSRTSHMSQFGYRSTSDTNIPRYEKILTLETPFPIADVDCTSTGLYTLLQSTETTLSLWELQP